VDKRSTDRDKKRQHTIKRTRKGKGGNEASKHRLSTTRVNKMTTRWGGMEKQNSNENKGGTFCMKPCFVRGEQRSF
jgi:hypothetical protein